MRQRQRARRRDALALMLATGVDALAVTGPGTAPPSGIVTLARIRQQVLAAGVART